VSKAQRGEGARARNAVEDLNGGHRLRSVGSSPFKPQTALLSWSRAVGGQARLRVSIKGRAFKKGDKREASRASLVYGHFSAAMIQARRLAES
jgi:hypothetical protein